MQSVSVTADPNGTLDVALFGEIDFTNSAQVLDVIRDGAQRAHPAAIRVQMAQVTFLDSSGIGVLVHTMRLAEELDAAFRVQHPAPKVYDQLEMSGLLEAFRVEQSSPED